MQALNGAAAGVVCLAYEPNSDDREYPQPFRHIQYNRIANFRPMPTLTMLLWRRIAVEPAGLVSADSVPCCPHRAIMVAALLRDLSNVQIQAMQPIRRPY